MGDSGAIGSIFSSILLKINIHGTSVKEYILPKTVDSEILLIKIIISENIDKILTLLDVINKYDYKIVTFSSRAISEKLTH